MISAHRAKVASRMIAFIAAAGSTLLVLGVLSSGAAAMFSNLVYPMVAFGAVGVLATAGLRLAGRERVAWCLMAVGVALSGTGETLWAWYEVVLETEAPFPGIPDFAYLAAYPVFAAAVILIPRLAGNSIQRAQQVIDGILATTAASLVAWVTVLEPMFREAGETGLDELLVGAAYPVGDVLLLASLGTFGLRRTRHVRHRALWAIVAALLVMAAGDIIYLVQTWTDTYASGSWVDATWLMSYGFFALAAGHLEEAAEERHPRQHRLPLWHLLIPVMVVVALIVLNATDLLEETPVMDLVVTGFGLLILARILLVVTEDRRLLAKERRQLISVVSHELRTPLTAVQGYLDLALEEWENLDEEERKEMVLVARDQSHLITRIVTDLISSSRERLHSTELRREVVDLRSTIREAIQILGLEEAVRLDVPAGLLVSADPGRLNQIIINLIGNAARYGGGRIECIGRTAAAHVEIQIHDDGPGIPGRFRDRIWNRFERGSHQFDASVPGSGLGLAIVRSLVLAHGGEVGYRPSALLGGACFWFRLPTGTVGALPAPVPVLSRL